MSGKRPPAPAPAIDGFTYLNPLGSGGFSDVYLYEQDRPRRKVAVKVLLADVTSEAARRRFESEANLMAQLSTHPYIVTIYEADISGDGRSYLAMEYCSRPGLDARYRRSLLRVDEALTLGIQISSAVETAHRAGIIHRDIKPANVLTTDYNRPALTDFGISGTAGAAADDAGLSIPWSAPEAFAGGQPDGVRMDVYSLGATIYTLLAGHSPFVRRGGDNTQSKLIHRITNAPLEPLTRQDVPVSLNQALAVAMAKSPGSRFESAAQLARALQRIQAELGLGVTPFEVLDEAHIDPDPAHGPDDGEATRVRSVQSIDGAQTAARSRGAGGAAWTAEQPAPAETHAISATSAPEATPSFTPAGSAQPARPARQDQQLSGFEAAQEADDGQVERQRFPKALVGIIVGLAVIVGGAVLVNALSTEEDPRQAVPSLGSQDDPADAMIGGVVPVVDGFKYSTEGENVTFTWSNPEPQQGDFYQWTPVTAAQEGEVQRTDAAAATTPRRADGPTCIEVLLVRDDGRVSEPVRHCTGDASASGEAGE
ncbi:serine/threonine-protein kinase [Zhihengliuella flava]|uniref:non-specific serine/threonine protein kinase n=1 Tax=Zhihengliuella flava TaxID=1285193 RepID=A0A931D8E1_9MICC|nr:serine/threonine protein kinase [Zhihengliuella flava]